MSMSVGHFQMMISNLKEINVAFSSHNDNFMLYLGEGENQKAYAVTLKEVKSSGDGFDDLNRYVKGEE